MKRLKPTIFATAALCLYTFSALAEEVAEAAGEDVGFPQIKQSDTFASQVFWLAVSFVLLYTLMAKVALPRVGGIIDSRKKARQDNLSEAGKLSDEAAKVTKAYEASLAKAQGTAQALLRDAEDSIAARITAEDARFGEAARRRLGDTEQAIRKAKADAMNSLADISAEIAADMSGKIAGVQVSKADAKIVVTGLMKEAA